MTRKDAKALVTVGLFSEERVLAYENKMMAEFLGGLEYPGKSISEICTGSFWTEVNSDSPDYSTNCESFIGTLPSWCKELA